MIVEVAVPVLGAVVADKPVKLDALLEWSVSRELGLPWLARSDAIPDPLPIPVDRIEYPGGSLYLCTDWVTSTAAPYRHDWVRRRDGLDVEALARPFNRSYGPGRDLLLRAYGAHVSAARWLVSTRDPERLAVLLRRVTHLGKLRAHGCGELGGGWSVTEVHDAAPIRTLVDGDIAARVLPVAALDSWEGPPHRLAVEPPYWHPERQVAAVPAGTRVAIRSGLADTAALGGA